MAKSNKKIKNEKKEKKVTPGGFTESGKGKRLGTKGWMIIITAAVLAAIIIFFIVFFSVRAYKKDADFDYITSDLSKYVSFDSEKYKNYDLNIDIAAPHVKGEDGKGISDVEVAILNLRASYAEAVGDSSWVRDIAVGAGDKVKIWYRGYLVHPTTGEEIEVDGMCNFGNTASSELGIGSGSFIPGFELNLIGTLPTDFARFTKITSGVVKEEQIIYFSYNRSPVGSTDTKDRQIGDCVRIDLSRDDLDEIYGEGFRAAILGATIGDELEFTTKIGDVEYKYSSPTGSSTSTTYKTMVEFATVCEKEETNGGVPVKVVECYFPYDYGTEGLASAKLRNETAYFEVYIDFVQDYTVPEWDDEFIKKVTAEKGSAITEKELNEKYEGETLVEKYTAYANEYLEDAYEEARKALIEQAMWDHYLKSATIKRYPGNKVDAIYKEYVDDVYYQFSNNPSITDPTTQELKTYETVDEYAVVYLGLTYQENPDWRGTLLKMSRDLVAERLILYYIIQNEELIVPGKDDTVLAEKIKDVKQEYLDEYVKQFLEYEEKTREDFTDSQYADYVKEREKELFDYYDDDYFTETAYYEIALEIMLGYPKVHDLNERTAYPYAEAK